MCGGGEGEGGGAQCAAGRARDRQSHLTAAFFVRPPQQVVGTGLRLCRLLALVFGDVWLCTACPEPFSGPDPAAAPWGAVGTRPRSWPGFEGGVPVALSSGSERGKGQSFGAVSVQP